LKSFLYSGDRTVDSRISNDVSESGDFSNSAPEPEKLKFLNLLVMNSILMLALKSFHVLNEICSSPVLTEVQMLTNEIVSVEAHEVDVEKVSTSP
jgi:hypothetical protein